MTNQSQSTDQTSIYQTSEKQIEELKKMRWTHKVSITPVPEQYRYEFVSAMLKQNFMRMVQGAKFGMIVIGLMAFLIDVVKVQMSQIAMLNDSIVLRYLLLAVLVLGYIAGKRLRITDSNASMMSFFIWANLFRGSFACIRVYIS